MTEPDWRRLNRANRDERVAIHLKSRTMYGRAALRAGTARPEPLSAAVLGALPGQKIPHLQCHFGMDLLALVQNGADVVGIDFSAPAIATARRRASELGLARRPGCGPDQHPYA
jgi:2-polyprenyl-3-methyl-5-hydroxy-6-metoxy-1,4-benzoquinol methylase